MDQARLFDSEPAGSVVPSRNFLSTNARVFAALARGETIRRLAKAAVEKNSDAHGDDRNAAAPFEDRFKALLLKPANAAHIASETVLLAAEDGITISDVTIGKGKNHALADILIGYNGPDGHVTVATNIKRLKSNTTHTEGGSILSFLRLALDPTYDPADPPTTRGYRWEQVIVEWLAGKHKIRPGRDYMFLCVYADAGKYSGLDTWPVISGMNGDRPAVTRHTNRAVLEVYRPTGTIPPGYDVNRHLAQVLLPSPNPDAVRALLTSLALAIDPYADARKTALRISSLTDEDVVRLVKQANGPR